MLNTHGRRRNLRRCYTRCYTDHAHLVVGPTAEAQMPGKGLGLGLANGTNNIAGLRAVLDALQRPPDVSHLVIQIDSTYAPDCSTTWCAGTTRLSTVPRLVSGCWGARG